MEHVSPRQRHCGRGVRQLRVRQAPSHSSARGAGSAFLLAQAKDVRLRGHLDHVLIAVTVASLVQASLCLFPL